MNLLQGFDIETLCFSRSAQIDLKKYIRTNCQITLGFGFNRLEYHTSRATLAVGCWTIDKIDKSAFDDEYTTFQKNSHHKNELNLIPAMADKILFGMYQSITIIYDVHASKKIGVDFNIVHYYCTFSYTCFSKVGSTRDKYSTLFFIEMIPMKLRH